jgi:hypothetical protein
MNNQATNKEQRLNSLLLKKKADADRLVLEIDAALQVDMLENKDWLDVVDEKITQLSVLQLTMQHLGVILLNSNSVNPSRPDSTDNQPPPPPPPPPDRKITEGEKPSRPPRN